MAGRFTRMAVALLAMGFVLPGCLVNTKSRTEVSGRYVGAEAFSQIEEGRSTPDFVLATLGEPTCRTAMSDGSEVWKWQYKKTRSGSGSVFLLLSASDHSETESAAYITFRDGVVARKWRDGPA